MKYYIMTFKFVTLYIIECILNFKKHVTFLNARYTIVKTHPFDGVADPGETKIFRFITLGHVKKTPLNISSAQHVLRR